MRGISQKTGDELEGGQHLGKTARQPLQEWEPCLATRACLSSWPHEQRWGGAPHSLRTPEPAPIPNCRNWKVFSFAVKCEGIMRIGPYPEDEGEVHRHSNVIRHSSEPCKSAKLPHPKLCQSEFKLLSLSKAHVHINILHNTHIKARKPDRPETTKVWIRESKAKIIIKNLIRIPNCKSHASTQLRWHASQDHGWSLWSSKERNIFDYCFKNTL